MGSLGVILFGVSIRKLTTRIKDETLLIVGTVISILYLLGFALARHLPTVFLSNLLGGAAHVTILATSYSYASRLIPPEKRGKQFALFNATRFLSWGIPATFLVGPLVDKLIQSGFPHVFAYRMAFFAAAVLVIVGAFILVYAIRLHSQTQK
jgi:predicted MFS family arabinose efflux permease